MKQNKIFNYLKSKVSSISIFELFSLLSVIFVLIFIVKYFSIKREWRTIMVEVVGRNWSENFAPYGYRTPFWLSDKLEIGQIEKNTSGRIIAKIIGLEKFVRDTEENEAYLIIQVETTYHRRQSKYMFKNKGLDLGAAIELNLDNILIIGQIIDNNYPINGYPTKEIVVTARGRNIEPWIVSSVKPGLKMFNQSNEKPIAEIISTRTEPASGSQVIIDNNNLMLISNSGRQKDLLVTAKINVFLKDGRWYFAGHQNIMIGNPFYLYTPIVNLYNLEIENVQGL